VDAGSNQISVRRITAGGVPVLAGRPAPAQLSYDQAGGATDDACERR
jgi:hypothetical protein